MLKDYTKFRDSITTNYLQNLILKIDFEDIIEFETSTIKSFTNFLRELGFDKKNTILNELNFKLNRDLKDFNSSDSFVYDNFSKNSFAFINQNKQISIEIAPFYITINKFDNFEHNYEGFDFFSNLLLKLSGFLIKHEQISWKHLNIRKVNSFRSQNISDFSTHFAEFIVNDIENNPFQDNLLNYNKNFKILENSYNINNRINLQKGVLLSDNKPKNIFLLLLDFNIDYDINSCSTSNEFLKKILENMNTQLFNLFMNSFKEDALNNYIIKNKKLFDC